MNYAEQYTYCLLDVNQDSYYCQVVNLIGKMPESNSWIYDISFMLFFACFLIVILSPFYLLVRFIKGFSKGGR